MPKLEVNDIEMYFETYGEGEPLVLLHGFTSSSQMWKPWIPPLETYFQLIIPDLRGHGRSTNPSQQYTAKQSSQDISILLDKLNVDKFNAIGCSGGGDVLLHLATLQPERIRKMVLDGTTPYFTEQTRKGYRNFNPSDELMDHYHQIHQNGEDQIYMLINQFREMANSYDDVNFPPDLLSKIQAEALIILGDRDKYISVDMAVELYESIANSYLWIVPNGGHAVTVTHFDFLKKGIINFFLGNWK